jgi:hypothetical protein
MPLKPYSGTSQISCSGSGMASLNNQEPVRGGL